MQDFVVSYHLVGFVNPTHVDVIVTNSLRSGNSDPVVPIILCTILGKSGAGSITMSRIKGAHYRQHAAVHQLNN